MAKNKNLSPGSVSSRPRSVSSRPLWDGDQIRAKLRRYDRTPFIDVLTTFLECSPDPQSILKFANKYPDRYAAALRSLGHLAGFAEKKEIQASLSGTIEVTDLSDSQLEDRLRDLARNLGIPMPPILDMRTTKPIEAEDAEVIPLPPIPSSATDT